VFRAHKLSVERALTPAAILVLAALLRVIAGVGFANYDTLYALAWGGQLSRGATPAYETAIAPTPHPLVEAIGFVLSPLSPRAIEDIAVALGFIALAGCGWVIYALGTHWFGRAAGVLAALIFLTRVPVLSYGVRAYIDIPYLLFVLWGLLLIARTPHKPVAPLALFAVAGLLRPEAWVFSGLYLLHALDWMPAWTRRALERIGAARDPARARRSRAEVLGLVLLAASAPIVWLVSDLAVTGDALWSLKNTRHTAHELGRVTGIANVPQYIPRRGERSGSCSRCGGCASARSRRLPRDCSRWSCSRCSRRSVCRSIPAMRSSPRRSAACSRARGCSAGACWRARTDDGAGGSQRVLWSSSP